MAEFHHKCDYKDCDKPSCVIVVAYTPVPVVIPEDFRVAAVKSAACYEHMNFAMNKVSEIATGLIEEGECELAYEIYDPEG